MPLSVLNNPKSSHYDLIIAGAGLAGMTLARELIERNFQGRVLLLDKRSDYSRDQRWCVWEPVDAKIKDLAAHRWANWQAESSTGQSLRFTVPQTAYTEFQAEQYFDSIASLVSQYSNFEIGLGVEVTKIAETQDGVEVVTPGGAFMASMVIDSRNEGALAEVDRDPDEPWLIQSFVGWTVKIDRAFFDVDCAILMDFRVPDDGQGKGEFFYVLPYGPQEALVECTVVSPEILPLATYRNHLEWYLNKAGISDWTTLSEEIGAIPMTSQRLPMRSTRILWLGTAAGAVKPSTGYGFARIQQQADEMAQYLTDGKPRSPKQESRRDVIDAVFLDVLAQSPKRLEELMMRMFRKLPPELIVKFLSERTTVLEDLRVMGAVGDLGFAKPAVRRVRKMLGR